MIKDYIVTYRSREHYEVLGWLRAESLEDAKSMVNNKFKDQIKKYGVVDAMIAEWGNSDNIHL
ncbi:MAG: hypothetical protein PHO58_04360 [Bacilli bacterium]|nr:hypothetical protein [Candidatus Paceibacterota bacterium]MDD4411714.1 hypothetical protein [Bacilli bacterium]